MKRSHLCLLLMTLACWANSGCGLRIGPTVETQTVVVHVGQPLQILRNVTVTGRRLGDNVQVEQDIGGWVVMPLDHFNALARAAGLQPLKESTP